MHDESGSQAVDDAEYGDDEWSTIRDWEDVT